MAGTVDRSIARLIAYKRIVTGVLAFAAGLATLVLSTTRPFTPLSLVALALFFGGGAWALRDGLRLRRELSR